MSRYFQLGNDYSNVYDLEDGSLKTNGPVIEFTIRTVNGGTKFISIWSAEALLEAIGAYADAEGLMIRSVPAFVEEEIGTVYS